MTKYKTLFDQLAAPFSDKEIKRLVIDKKKNVQAPYVTARTIMNRLDDVLGPENWWDDYKPSEDSVLCILSIRLPDGSVLTKCDAGGYPDMKSDEDSEKGGFSDAFKRAAVKFRVARYLYGDGISTLNAARDDAGIAQAKADPLSQGQGSQTRQGTAVPEEPSKVKPDTKPEGLATPFWNRETTFVGFSATAVEMCNSEWKELYPDASPDWIVKHEELVMYLVQQTWERAMHPMAIVENPGTKIGEWIGLLDRLWDDDKIRKWMKKHIIHFLDKRFSEMEKIIDEIPV